MAELDVQPKRPGLWWLWLLLGVIAIVILFTLFKGQPNRTTAAGTAEMTATKALAKTTIAAFSKHHL